MSVTKYAKDKSFAITTHESMSTSNAKQKFSFAKAQRFKTFVDNGVPVAYDQNSQLGNRAAAFGYGNKIDLADKKSKHLISYKCRLPIADDLQLPQRVRLNSLFWPFQHLARRERVRCPSLYRA